MIIKGVNGHKPKRTNLLLVLRYSLCVTNIYFHNETSLRKYVIFVTHR